jgi:transposase
VRAYGGAARDCLRAAQKEFVKAQVCVCFASSMQLASRAMDFGHGIHCWQLSGCCRRRHLWPTGQACKHTPCFDPKFCSIISAATVQHLRDACQALGRVVAIGVMHTAHRLAANLRPVWLQYSLHLLYHWSQIPAPQCTVATDPDPSLPPNHPVLRIPSV